MPKLARALRSIAALALFALASCGRPSVTGTYLMSAADGTMVMTIVESAQHSLTGSAEILTIAADGTLADNELAVTGAIQGMTVTVTWKAEELLSTARSYAGTFDDRQITIDGATIDGGHAHLVFTKVTSKDAQRALEGMRRAAAIRRTKIAAMQEAQREAAARVRFNQAVEQLTREDLEYAGRRQHGLDVLAKARDLVTSVTARMQRGLAREQQIMVGTEAAVARMQIVIALQNLNAQTETYNSTIKGAEQIYQSSGDALSSRNETDVAACIAHETDACPALISAARAFAGSRSSVNTAFDGFEALMNSVEGEQQRILEAAQEAQQQSN